MNALFLFIAKFIPTAHAGGIDAIGGDSPGIASMWAQIRATFPYSTTDTHLPTVIAARIVTLVTTVIGIAAVIAIVYSGIQVVISAGDDGKLTQAKTTIMYALIGVALAILGRGVMLYMCNKVLPIIFGGGSACSLV